MNKTIKEILSQIFGELKTEFRSIKTSKNILFADLSGFLIMIAVIALLPLSVLALFILYRKADKESREYIHQQAESDAPWWANYYEFNPWKGSITYYRVFGSLGSGDCLVFCRGEGAHLKQAAYYGVLIRVDGFRLNNDGLEVN